MFVGNLFTDKVPLETLVAFVVSVVALAARPESCVDGIVGRRARARVPVVIFPASVVFVNPVMLDAGMLVGRRATFKVPELIFDAFVVSMVPEFASPLTLEAGNVPVRRFVGIEPVVSVPTSEICEDPMNVCRIVFTNIASIVSSG